MSASMKEVTEKLQRIKPPGPYKVWEVVEKIGRDGRPIKFTIQEIPEDRYEDVFYHMYMYFMVDEPTCECLKSRNEPAFIVDCNNIWRQMLEQGISVAAFVDNPDGGKPIIAGLNILGIDFRDNEPNEDFPFTAKQSATVFKVFADLNKKAQIYEHFGVDKYIFALGLSVAPMYRGYGLATHILRAREKIGREYNIAVTSTPFTSTASYKSAERADFEVILEENYANILDENGKEYFPGIKADVIKVMAKKFF